MKNSRYWTNYMWMIVLAMGLAIFAYLYYEKPNIAESEIMQVTFKSQSPAPSSVPSPLPSPLAMTQISGDGTHTLSVKQDGELADIAVNGEMIMSYRGDRQRALSIPYNTWSPDNKYFFIAEKMGDEVEYLAMTRTGKPFAGGEPYLKVASLYREAYPDNTILSVSGWADRTLIILNASSASEANMSFWFDVQSKKFIRLSTNFY